MPPMPRTMSRSIGTVTGEAEEMSEKDQRNAAAAIDEFELPLVSVLSHLFN